MLIHLHRESIEQTIFCLLSASWYSVVFVTVFVSSLFMFLFPLLSEKDTFESTVRFTRATSNALTHARTATVKAERRKTKCIIICILTTLPQVTIKSHFILASDRCNCAFSLLPFVSRVSPCFLSLCSIYKLPGHLLSRFSLFSKHCTRSTVKYSIV